MKRKDKGMFSQLLSSVAPVIASALQNPAVGPVNLLKDMRQVLAVVNSTNDNVKSIPVTSFGIETKGSFGAIDVRRELQSNAFWDLGLTSFSIDLLKQEMMMRVPYSYIRNSHFVNSPPSLKVQSIPGILFYPDLVFLFHIF